MCPSRMSSADTALRNRFLIVARMFVHPRELIVQTCQSANRGHNDLARSGSTFLVPEQPDEHQSLPKHSEELRAEHLGDQAAGTPPPPFSRWACSHRTAAHVVAHRWALGRAAAVQPRLHER